MPGGRNDAASGGASFVVESISLGLQLFIFAFMESKWMPKAQPEIVQKWILRATTVFSMTFTARSIPIGPGALPFNPLYFCAALVALAVLSPVVGIWEAR